MRGVEIGPCIMTALYVAVCAHLLLRDLRLPGGRGGLRPALG